MKKENLKKKIEKYRNLTKEALEKAALQKHATKKEAMMANKLLEMARAYFEDAKYFESKKMFLTALAAYSYAHAWLDAGVMLGLLDGKNDDKLFILP
jgi:hypothetical protein